MKTSNEIGIPHVDRLLYLYSESNAEEADVVDFWEEKIVQYCVKKRSLSFTPGCLIEEFTVNDIYPSSFMPVLNGLLVRKRFVGATKDLLASETQVDALQTLFSAISLWNNAPDTAKESFIPFGLLRDIEEFLVGAISQLPDRAVFVSAHRGLPTEHTFAGLLQKAAQAKEASALSQLISNLGTKDQQMLLQHMVNTKKAAFSADRTIVKILFAKPSAAPTSSFSLFGFASSSSSAMETVSEAEEATLRLHSSIHQVEAKVEELRLSVQEELNKAKKCKVSFRLLTVAFYTSKSLRIVFAGENNFKCLPFLCACRLRATRAGRCSTWQASVRGSRRATSCCSPSWG